MLPSITLIVSLLLVIVADHTNAFLEEDFFPRDPRHLFFSGRARNRLPALREGVEQAFVLKADQWEQYILQGGAGTQECFCIADCTTGDVELFVQSSRTYQLDDNYDWECQAPEDPDKAQYCRVQPGTGFDCYVALYGLTETTDCGVSCRFNTPV